MELPTKLSISSLLNCTVVPRTCGGGGGNLIKYMLFIMDDLCLCKMRML